LFNQVLLVGRMTKDPELRFTPEGTAVSKFTLALNRPYKTANGGHEADFISCHSWRKVAENTAAYCQKGSLVAVSGRIQTRNYENQDGNRVYVTEVVAERIRFLDRRNTPTEMEQEAELVFEEEAIFMKE
jgi:single-strand DNA-binding protein